ncbi:MAG: hypothetical protein ACRYFX_18550 [Janthinobacterium lividum]
MYTPTAETTVAEHRLFNAQRAGDAFNIEAAEARLLAARLEADYRQAKTTPAFADACREAADHHRARRLALETRQAERQREALSYLSRPAA